MTDATKHNGGLEEVGTTSRGYTIFRERNEVGGHRYWSDEIGGGVMVWDTCIADSETLRRCLEIEAAHAREAGAQEPVADTEAVWNATKKLVSAGELLSLAAQTAGGTAGRDEWLCEAIEQWSKARDALEAVRRIVWLEPAGSSAPAAGTHHAPAQEPVAVPARMTADEAWQDLCEKDDRTSIDYPGFALIRQDELAAYMAAAPVSPAADSGEDDGLPLLPLKERVIGTISYHTPAPQPGGAGCPHCSGTGQRQDKRTGKNYPCPRCEPSPAQCNAGAARAGWMLMNDNGKRWRICGPAGRWVMKPEGAITADEARTICETAMGTALPLPTPAGEG